MELFFKMPSKEAREAMCDASLELGNRFMGNEYKKNAEDAIKKVTGHEHARVMGSGNAAIMAAMSTMKGPVMIPDQGGWSGFRKIAEFYGLELTYLSTKMGVIHLETLEEQVKLKSPESLFITSFAGYMAEQPVKGIYDICEDNGVILVEDASGSVGDPLKNLACGDHSHVMVASTGSPKIVNVGNGGFISTNEPGIFNNAGFILKTLQSSPVTCAGLVEEIKKTPGNLVKTIAACEFLKKEIEYVLHPEKRGINIAIPHDEPKSIARLLRNNLKVMGGGMITVCPRYDRINQPAVCLEVKNLDIECLKKENLRKIVEIVKNTI
ncbi:DegT/DnrJ/EryC1/StrS family aminotransferase [Methanobacterium sp.]|uniref:DegT/DnrJ/EryC1/StrS family aminotransferase n=1 Tax=Methanobacterium sp. TaxID=2164 RepID=UPI002600270C|nr:DegT/DnrJ/EryC1/StrS family aminotransferase [Methanobacterium sp.]MBI5458444.1 DegT/DnrJ/EryC1/StrS family aminotransferase [Methanobacterium sp.]MDY9923527.1 DegT/DnrJ/EryC1/StrS family aminotransferase [Methanobacterium sp.]